MAIEHHNWLKPLSNTIVTSDGKQVELLEFEHDVKNLDIMSKWAKHFRNHYCLDSQIDILRDGTGYSRTEYLVNEKFPDASTSLGPAIRAGDFGEILMADYLQYILDHWVPRTRYRNKTVKDESTKGVDVIGFKIFDENKTVNDILTTIEVKTQFSGKKAESRLQDAIDGSSKDELRLSESLNAIKQRFLDKEDLEGVAKIARFQSPIDKPYKHKYGAAALFNDNVFVDTVITDATTVSHVNKQNLFLIVVKGKDLMKIVNKLYELAANEA